MERTREEALVGSPLRRPNQSRGDLSGQARMGSMAAADGPPQGLATEHTNALEYLREVKETYRDRKEKYDEFLEVMKDFKSGRIGTDGVIDRVKELFEGNSRLILGFNNFLPRGFEIRLPPKEKKPVDFGEAMAYVNRIKQRFQGEEQIYKSFLDILSMYRNEHKSIHDVYQEVAALFHSHHDLLEEFTHFLPEATATMAPCNMSSGRDVLHRDERSSMVPIMRHAYGDKGERNYYSHADQDRSVDRRHPDHDSHQRHIVKERDRKEDRDRRDPEQDKDRDLCNAPCRLKLPRRVDDIAVEKLHDGVEGVVFSFWEKVKEKLHTGTYQEFLKCLKIYNKEIISKTELKNLVSDILGKYPDLIDGFNEFLSHCENIDAFLADIFNTRNSARPSKVEVRDMDRVHEKNEKERVNERDRLDKCASLVSKDAAFSKSPLLTNSEKFNLWKPISELDLSNCELCTPSYRLLPKNYPIPPASHRTEVGASILNDVWVSVTSGSEDYSFKHMRKNQYEESLFKCEDDRFELDMLLESVNATTRRVEELLAKLQDSRIKQESQICIEDHFTSLQLRCIERLYGDHGIDVMDILRKNCSRALPVILTRLKQKQEEWSMCRSDFNKVWAEIYAKNYHKSLDHRSFYFKQQDSKSLSTKALFAEIKAISENKHKEDVFLAITAGYKQPIVPQMEFEYIDSDVHEDLYQIIKYSCGEVCSSADLVDKIMRIWTMFLEPIFGVPYRAQGTEDPEDVVKIKRHPVKIGVIKESNGCAEANTNRISVISNDDYIPPEQASSRLENGVTAVHENGIHGVDPAACQCDKICVTSAHGNVQYNAYMADELSGITVQNAFVEQLEDNVSLATVAEQSHINTNMEYTSGVSEISPKSDHTVVEQALEPQLAKEVLHSIGGGENARSVVFTSGGCTTETDKFCRLLRGACAHDKLTSEKEEGESSPNGGSEKDNFGVFEDAAIDVVQKNGSTSLRYQDTERIVGEVARENDADADNKREECAQRTTESTDSASEAGVDVLASESGDGEECSHDGEEEEDANNDDKVESQVEAEELADTHDADGDITSLSHSECFLRTAKPLAMHVPVALRDKEDKGSQIFYGNETFYVLFRLHQTLYERLLSAKTNSSTAERKWRASKDTCLPDLYTKFKNSLYSLLDGSTDNTKFEDDCCAIIGAQSYVLFTLDKLILKLVKQLKIIALDEMGNKLIHLYMYEKSRRSGSFCNIVYHENVHALLHDESIFRFECSSSPTRLSIQLMDYGHDKSEMTAVSVHPKFTADLCNDFLSSDSYMEAAHGIFLRRNKRKYEGDDEYSATCKAIEGVHVTNGLECKISSNPPEVSYVFGTEDLFHRTRKKSRYSYGPTGSCCNQANFLKVERFHHFLSRARRTNV